jgi:hypothetical protein
MYGIAQNYSSREFTARTQRSPVAEVAAYTNFLRIFSM